MAATWGRVALLLALCLASRGTQGRLTSRKVAISHAAMAPASNSDSKEDTPDSSFEPPKDYQRVKRPPSVGPEAPTSVYVDLDIHQLYGIDAHEGTATVEARLELKWNDTRLFGQVAKGPATPINPASVWVPKMTFSNQVDKPLVVASLMTLNEDGEIKYRRRIKITCSQSFTGLADFPFDHHTVKIELESYGFSADEVLLHPWSSEKNKVEMGVNKPIWKELKGVTSGTWNIWSFEMISEIRKSLNYDRDCYFKGRMYISRKTMMPFMEIVFPLILTVALSLSALCYRLQALDIRTNLAIIGLFTTLMYLYVVKEDLPPISYLTWTHWYMIVCLVFVGIVMIEITICHWLDPSGEAAEQQIEEAEAAMHGVDPGDVLERRNTEQRKLTRNVSLLVTDGARQFAGRRASQASLSNGADEPLLEKAEDRRASNASARKASQMSLPSSTKRLLTTFNLIDTDGDGYLDAEELMEALQKLGKHPTRDAVDKIITDTKAHFDSLGLGSPVEDGDDAKDGDQKPNMDELERSLTFEEFVWAVENKAGDGQLEAFHKRQIWGINETHVPMIDKWCCRGLPAAFAFIVLIMLLAETPNMAYGGPQIDIAK